MTQLAARSGDRRAIAKRIYDALCADCPDKYIALIQPSDRTQRRTKLRVGTAKIGQVKARRL